MTPPAFVQPERSPSSTGTHVHKTAEHIHLPTETLLYPTQAGKRTLPPIVDPPARRLAAILVLKRDSANMGLSVLISTGFFTHAVGWRRLSIELSRAMKISIGVNFRFNCLKLARSLVSPAAPAAGLQASKRVGATRLKGQVQQ